jgi:hypothetical protein
MPENLRAGFRNYKRANRFGGLKRKVGSWQVGNPEKSALPEPKKTAGFPCNLPAD